MDARLDHKHFYFQEAHFGHFLEYILFSVDDVDVGTLKMNTSFWDLGGFNNYFENPWSSGSKMAPFDQEVSRQRKCFRCCNILCFSFI